jgi:putative addiction module antidote
VGQEAVLVLPSELIERLGLKPGDAVTVTELGNSFSVAPYEPSHDEVMELARTIMDEYRTTLETLAK